MKLQKESYQPIFHDILRGQNSFSWFVVIKASLYLWQTLNHCTMTEEIFISRNFGRKWYKSKELYEKSDKLFISAVQKHLTKIITIKICSLKRYLSFKTLYLKRFSLVNNWSNSFLWSKVALRRNDVSPLKRDISAGPIS